MTENANLVERVEVWLNFRSFPNNDPEMDVVMDRPSE
jgi:hypothetical protein